MSGSEESLGDPNHYSLIYNIFPIISFGRCFLTKLRLPCVFFFLPISLTCRFREALVLATAACNHRSSFLKRRDEGGPWTRLYADDFE